MPENQMYLVPGRLTDEQDTHLRDEGYFPSNFLIVAKMIGTPIQPCADVETVCVALPNLYDNLARLSCAQVYPVSMRSRNGTDIDLVRRSDMDAQVAIREQRIARLKETTHGFIDEISARDKRINALLNAIREAIKVYEEIPEDAADSSDEIDAIYSILHRALRTDLSPAAKNDA